MNNFSCVSHSPAPLERCLPSSRGWPRHNACCYRVHLAASGVRCRWSVCYCFKNGTMSLNNPKIVAMKQELENHRKHKWCAKRLDGANLASSRKTDPDMTDWPICVAFTESIQKSNPCSNSQSFLAVYNCILTIFLKQ